MRPGEAAHTANRAIAPSRSVISPPTGPRFIFGHVVNTKTGAAGTVNGGTSSFDNAHGTILVVGPGNVSWITLRFTTAH